MWRQRWPQGRSCADSDDHQQIPFKSLLFIPNDPIENQDYYTSTPVPKISSFAPGTRACGKRSGWLGYRILSFRQIEPMFPLRF